MILSLFNTLNTFGTPMHNRAPEKKAIQDNSDDRINDTILYSLLLKHNVLHPEIVIAQAKLETGNYKSKLCRINNNLFGIRLKGKYAKFSTYEESVLAYKNKIQNRLRNNEDYYKFLKRIGYAKSANYTSKVRNMVKSVKIPYNIETI